MKRQWRLGLVGCGQVYHRLHLPALRHVPGLELTGAVDPAGTPVGIHQYKSLAEMCSSGSVDCVAVLSPPELHAAQVQIALQHGVPVLVEKPPAMSAVEMEGWAALDADNLLTPAFSRRYWRIYRTPQPEIRNWKLTLRTDPSAWGATHESAESIDLLPHVIDLARWLSGREIERVEAQFQRQGIAGTFFLGSGVRFAWEVGHGSSYIEQLEADGRAVPPQVPFRLAVARRLHRAPEEDVSGVASLLVDWWARLSGEAPRSLPRLNDGRRCVETLEAVNQMLGAAGGPAALEQ